MRIWHNIYSNLITLESVFTAWDEFFQGKKKKNDVVVFRRYLEDNLFELHRSLRNKTYRHGGYKSFYIRDPKIRHISKASVRDRVVHHLVSNVLEKIFDPTFYVHSYSCRKNRGVHKAIEAFVKMARKVSKNNTSSLFVLKCDIKKFFASVDHEVLYRLLDKKIYDDDFMWLLKEIIDSFNADSPGKGMPIGNLTSQHFANIYMDPFDSFVKHNLNVKYYIRYADDFVIMAENKGYLEELVIKLKEFLEHELKLSLHPQKITIRDYYLGIDFLGYVVFPYFILPRTKTKKRLFRKIHKKVELYKMNKITAESLMQSVQSYLGYLTHANTYKLSRQLKNQIVFWLND